MSHLAWMSKAIQETRASLWRLFVQVGLSRPGTGSALAIPARSEQAIVSSKSTVLRMP